MSNETIEHWARIVFGVFEAENSIIDDWRDRLLAAKNDPNDDGKTAEAYVRAVAVEFLSKAMDYET